MLIVDQVYLCLLVVFTRYLNKIFHKITLGLTSCYLFSFYFLNSSTSCFFKLDYLSFDSVSSLKPVLLFISHDQST